MGRVAVGIGVSEDAEATVRTDSHPDDIVLARPPIFDNVQLGFRPAETVLALRVADARSRVARFAESAAIIHAVQIAVCED